MGCQYGLSSLPRRFFKIQCVHFIQYHDDNHTFVKFLYFSQWFDSQQFLLLKMYLESGMYLQVGHEVTVRGSEKQCHGLEFLGFLLQR